MSLSLQFVEVDSFKSINQRVKLHLDERITVLVGANDHGKSNILHAIQYLNDDENLADEDLYCGKNPRNSTGKPPLPEIGFGFKLPIEMVQPIFEKIIAGTYTWNDKIEPSLQSAVQAYLSSLSSLRQLPKEYEITIVAANNQKPGMWFRSVIPTGSSEIKTAVGKVLLNIALGERPEVLFFDGPPILPYKVSSDAFEDTDDPVLLGLLKLAKCEGKAVELGSPENIGRRTRMTFNQNLTKAFDAVYSQHKGIEWEIQLTDADTKLTLEINDHSRQLASPLEKSLGFRTFAAYLLSLISYTGTDRPKGYVIVIDEPDCHLHPRGQKDMLRYLEDLSEENQIVYATHSPFMVPKSFPHRVRGVRRLDTGTSIDDKPYRGSWSEVVVDLGLAGADMFAFSDKYLVVEGISDHLIIAALSGAIERKNGVALDLESIAVRSAETASNALAVTLALNGPEVLIVTLLDSDRAGDNAAAKITKLKKANVKVLQCKEFTTVDDAETEDLIPRSWIKPAMMELLSRLKDAKQISEQLLNSSIESLEQFEFGSPLKDSVSGFLVAQKVIESNKEYSPRLFGQCVAKVADDRALEILDSEQKAVEKLFDVISTFLKM